MFAVVTDGGRRERINKKQNGPIKKGKKGGKPA